MEKTFTISSKVVENIIHQYKELLEKRREKVKDTFYQECIKQLQKLNAKQLKEILETVFYASLEKEEGKQHHFSTVISPPEIKFTKLLKGFVHKHYVGYFNDVSSFKTPIKISALHKIAPAFEFTNRRLRLWFYKGNEIKIWGFANLYFDDTCIEIKTFSPGQLIINIFSSEYPLIRYLISFSRIERIISDFSLIDLLFSEVELKKARDTSNRESWVKYMHLIRRNYSLLIDLVNKTRNHEHGGIILIVPDEHINNVLKESFKTPIPYNPSIKYDVIKRTLNLEEVEYVKSQIERDYDSSLPWSFNEDINFIGQLSAVDGATIITKNFDVITFGAKIKPKDVEKNQDVLDYVWIKEPFENFPEHPQKVSDLGGTRHQSVAQFVFDQREKDVFAIVASQDGRVSIVYWDADRFWNDENNTLQKGIVTMFRHTEYLFFGINLV